MTPRERFNLPDIKIADRSTEKGAGSGAELCNMKNVPSVAVKVLLTGWKNHYRFWGNKLLIYGRLFLSQLTSWLSSGS